MKTFFSYLCVVILVSQPQYLSAVVTQGLHIALFKTGMKKPKAGSSSTLLYLLRRTPNYGILDHKLTLLRRVFYSRCSVQNKF